MTTSARRKIALPRKKISILNVKGKRRKMKMKMKMSM
jgi:hypothetical protein